MSTWDLNADRVIVHKNQQYAQASTGQRWWARIIDAVIILLVSSGSAALGYASEPLASDATATALMAFVLAYGVMVPLLGLLYGWGAGLGQMMTRVKSRRTSDGRRVGGFRGMMRYLGIGFLPLAIYSLLDAPTLWHDEIVVFKRRGQLFAKHQNSPSVYGHSGSQFARDPQYDARFTAPDPYQNGPRS